MESSTAALLSDFRVKNRVFRRACAQVVLLNLRIEDAKTHYLRARATGNLAFRYSYRMKLTSLEGVRDALYDFAVVKCEEIEALQAHLREVTGAVFYIVADEDSSDEDWSVAMASIITLSHCCHISFYALVFLWGEALWGYNLFPWCFCIRIKFYGAFTQYSFIYVRAVEDLYKRLWIYWFLCSVFSPCCKQCRINVFVVVVVILVLTMKFPHTHTRFSC